MAARMSTSMQSDMAESDVQRRIAARPRPQPKAAMAQGRPKIPAPTAENVSDNMQPRIEPCAIGETSRCIAWMLAPRDTLGEDEGEKSDAATPADGRSAGYSAQLV